MPNSMIAAWRAERPWLADTIVCDGLLPWANNFLPPGAKLADQLRRFHRNGVDHISLTAAAGREGAVEALGRLQLNSATTIDGSSSGTFTVHGELESVLNTNTIENFAAGKFTNDGTIEVAGGLAGVGWAGRLVDGVCRREGVG